MDVTTGSDRSGGAVRGTQMTTLGMASTARANGVVQSRNLAGGSALHSTGTGRVERPDPRMIARGQIADVGDFGESLWQPDPEIVEDGEGERLRVMLVDDHKIVREGLARLLRIEDDIDIVGEASDGRMAVKMAGELRPDVILMDVSMPEINGIEATRLIHAARPEIRVVGLSMYEPADMARAMQDAGADAYVPKAGPPEELLAAIRG